MNKRIFLSSLGILAGIVYFFTFSPSPLLAQERASWLTGKGIVGSELIPQGCREGRQAARSDCGIAQIAQTVVNITRLMLGIMGSAALLMFVYGGVYFILSAGNEQRITKGRAILSHAFIGIVIIFLSWSIINFIVIAVTAGREGLGQPAKIFDKGIEKTQPIKVK